MARYERNQGNHLRICILTVTTADIVQLATRVGAGRARRRPGLDRRRVVAHLFVYIRCIAPAGSLGGGVKGEQNNISRGGVRKGADEAAQYAEKGTGGVPRGVDEGIYKTDDFNTFAYPQ